MDFKTICDSLEEIKRQLGDFKKTSGPNIRRSTELNELFAALAKAQGEMNIAGKSSDNNFLKYKYANLDELVTAARPALSKNGLSVSYDIVEDNNQNYLLCTLGHNSGQWKQSWVKIVPAKTDIQCFGSTITYLKKYTYSSITGVVSLDEDDDGMAALSHEEIVEKKVNLKKTSDGPRINNYDTITQEQYEEIMYELENHPKLAQDILVKCNFASFYDMPKKDFIKAIEKIRRIKTAEPMEK